MPGSSTMSLARLCLNGVIKPVDYLVQKRARASKAGHVELSGIPFNLESYTDDECKIYFRFSKAEIASLESSLNLRRVFVLRTRTRFTGKEGLCILLRRLAYPNRLYDLVKMFNRDVTALSRIFRYMIEMVYLNYAKKLEQFSNAWLKQNMLEEFAEVCSEAGSPYSNIVGFIDGTNRSICRPTSNQQDFYSGYKKRHCVKYQSTVFPNGLIGRLDGAFIGRRHDTAILHKSKILEEMKAKFVNNDGTCYAVLGDPGYSNQKFIKVGFKNFSKLTEQQKRFNTDLSSLRVKVEYGFGYIVNQFAYLDFVKSQKLYETQVKKRYFVAAFFVNCQTCMRGNQISTYFNCAPPTLSEYLE